MGNIMSGQELISRQENAKVYGKLIFFFIILYTLFCFLLFRFNIILQGTFSLS